MEGEIWKVRAKGRGLKVVGGRARWMVEGGRMKCRLWKVEDGWYVV